MEWRKLVLKVQQKSKWRILLAMKIATMKTMMMMTMMMMTVVLFDMMIARQDVLNRREGKEQLNGWSFVAKHDTKEQ